MIFFYQWSGIQMSGSFCRCTANNWFVEIYQTCNPPEIFLPSVTISAVWQQRAVRASQPTSWGRFDEIYQELLSSSLRLVSTSSSSENDDREFRILLNRIGPSRFLPPPLMLLPPLSLNLPLLSPSFLPICVCNSTATALSLIYFFSSFGLYKRHLCAPLCVCVCVCVYFQCAYKYLTIFLSCYPFGMDLKHFFVTRHIFW